jgi:FdhD protein
MLPSLSHAKIELTKTITVVDERGRSKQIAIPAERALTIYLDKQELVTLMTLGAQPEALVLGYLLNQNLIASLDEVKAVQVDWQVSAAAVTSRQGFHCIAERTAKRVVTTGCGQGTIFGEWLNSTEQLQMSTSAQVTQSALYRMVEVIRTHPSIYKLAGSVHACALFNKQAELLYFVEDVGRHNAVDTISGLMALAGVQGEEMVFYTTGRLTSEMVMKAAHMGIPILLSRSGTTEMGFNVAEKLGISLFSRCSGRHFLLLTHAQRLISDVEHSLDGV